MRSLPNPRTMALPLLAFATTGCVQMKMTAQGGYTQVAVSGDIALSTTSGGLSGVSNQDFDSAFGLGQDRGSPYARLQLDLGVPVITVSGFTFDERGSGTVGAQFGNIAGGTAVDTELQFNNLKASCAFQLDLGPVAVAPGVAVDLFDLQMHVQDSGSSTAEDIDVFAPVPMAFLRAEADLGLVAAVAEVGYIHIPKIRDVEGTFWDAELLAEVRPTPLLHLFAGYRMLHLDGTGIVDNQDFGTNFDVAGWMIGGGFRF